MSGHTPTPGGAARLRRLAIVLATALAGLSVAVVVSVAVARSFTLSVSKHASVTNFNTHVTTRENVVSASRGLAVYTLSGDSKAHPKCTKANGCFKFWPPVVVSSVGKLSKASGISGSLGSWRRDGFIQVTLAGHPLYTFYKDTRDHAIGEAIVGFGGTWHVVKTSADPSTGTTTTTGMTSTSSTTTSSYPPGY